MPFDPASCSYCQNSWTNQNFTPTDGGPYDHYAHMGFVGYVYLNFTGLSPMMLRVTGCDLNLSQEISTPDVIDGSIDKTVYSLGPKIVEGSLNIPLIADVPPDYGALLSPAGACPPDGDAALVARTMLSNIWDWAMTRDPYGRLCFESDVDVRYANHASFKFRKCIVNTMTMSVTQGDAANVDLSVIGQSRDPENSMLTMPTKEKFMAPARQFMWNDVTINGVGGCLRDTQLFFSNQVREFTMEVNNNADRFFTLNGTLFPVDVNVGKREITGSMTLLGFNHRLRETAESNQKYFTEKNEIRIAYYLGRDSDGPAGSRDWWSDTLTAPNSVFSARLASVIFKIEEVSMTNDVLETTVNYLALASDKESANYEAVIPAPSCNFPAWAAW